MKDQEESKRNLWIGLGVGAAVLAAGITTYFLYRNYVNKKKREYEAIATSALVV